MNQNNEAAEPTKAVEQLAEQKAFHFPVSNEIFAEYRRLGDALWLYLFYIDRTTEEYADNGTTIGRVLGGVPRADADAASALGVTDKTIRKWRARLEGEGFIRSKQTGHGSIVEVLNSKKWIWKRKKADRNEHSGQTGKDVPSRPERTVRADRNERVVPIYDYTPTIQRPNSRQDSSDGADGFLKQICDLYGQKMGRVLVLKRNEKSKFISLRSEHGQEVVISAVRVHLDEKDNWDRMDYPASLFLNNPDGFIQSVARKRSEAEARAKQFKFGETFRDKTGREFKPEERDALKNLVDCYDRTNVWRKWMPFLESLDGTSDSPVADFIQHFERSLLSVR